MGSGSSRLGRVLHHRTGSKQHAQQRAFWSSGVPFWVSEFRSSGVPEFRRPTMPLSRFRYVSFRPSTQQWYAQVVGKLYLPCSSELAAARAVCRVLKCGLADIRRSGGVGATTCRKVKHVCWDAPRQMWSVTVPGSPFKRFRTKSEAAARLHFGICCADCVNIVLCVQLGSIMSHECFSYLLLLKFAIQH